MANMLSKKEEAHTLQGWEYVTYAAVAIILIVVIVAALTIGGVFSGAKKSGSAITSGNNATAASGPNTTTIGYRTGFESVTDGAQAQDMEVKTFLNNSAVHKAWNITVYTYGQTALGPVTAEDVINFNLTRNSSVIAYSLSKQTVKSSIGPGSEYNYSGDYNGTAVSLCYGNVHNGPFTFCTNSTELNTTNGTLALFAEMDGPIVESTSREISSSPYGEFNMFMAPNSSSVSYHFIGYTAYNGSTCALMNFSYGPAPGLLAGRDPGTISANGVTCFSLKLGLPLYTKAAVYGYNKTMDISGTVNGTMKMV